MIKLVVVEAFVLLLKVVVETYFPQFPISVELINVVVLTILALLGVDVVEFLARKRLQGLKERGLWK